MAMFLKSVAAVACLFVVTGLSIRAAEGEAKGHIAASDDDKKIVEKQNAAYALKTCPVTGEELGAGSTVNYIYKDRLVKLCCKGCIKKFEAKADDYLAALDKAAKAAAEKAPAKAEAPAKAKAEDAAKGVPGAAGQIEDSGGCGSCGGCCK